MHRRLHTVFVSNLAGIISGFNLNNIECISIALPGIFGNKGPIGLCHKLPLTGFDLSGDLGEFYLPVVKVNDVFAACWGGKEKADYYLTIGTGVNMCKVNWRISSPVKERELGLLKPCNRDAPKRDTSGKVKSPLAGDRSDITLYSAAGSTETVLGDIQSLGNANVSKIAMPILESNMPQTDFREYARVFESLKIPATNDNIFILFSSLAVGGGRRRGKTG